MIIPLAHVEHTAEFGGKAAQLGHAERAGLPVPPGCALSVSFVERVARGNADALNQLWEKLQPLGEPVAVRSSAIGEDAADASFAGQHTTVLNVRGREGLVSAIVHVYSSARTEAALSYRKRLGLVPEPRMAVVVQRLIHSECSGVLFTKNPVTGADERVIEAAWGLGEAVVAGLVTPDRYRVARGGKILERSIGDKYLAIMPTDTGGTHELALDPERAGSACLNDEQLSALDELASICEKTFGGSQDIEWTFAGSRLYLLQRRAITRG